MILQDQGLEALKSYVAERKEAAEDQRLRERMLDVVIKAGLTGNPDSLAVMAKRLFDFVKGGC